MEQRQMLTMSKFLIGIFNQKLIPCILRYAGIREQTKVSELSKTSFPHFFMHVRIWNS